MSTPDHTLNVLEYPAVLALVADYAASPRGVARLRALTPAPDRRLAPAETALLADAMALRAEGQALSAARFPDPAEPLERLGPEGVVLDVEALLVLRDFLGAVRDVHGRAASKDAARFSACASLATELDPCPDLWAYMHKVMDERGEILDRASDKLAEIRRQISALDRRIHSRLNSMLHNPDYAEAIQESLITVRNNRMVIPIKREYRARIRGVVHDQSGSGATLFMEPAAVLDDANDLAAARLEERDEIQRILRRLSAVAHAHLPRLHRGVASLTRYDVAQALSAWAGEFHCVVIPPTPVPDRLAGESGVGTPLLHLVAARHPLLQAQFRREKREAALIPIDLTLPADMQVLAVTGPNTGGKTVTLKTIGLLVCLAATGLPVPADPESRIPAIDTVLADIGDEQSIEQSLSTFSGHLLQIRDILERAQEHRALVLLDELGAGTDPVEGAALSCALLARLQRLDALTIATTHLGAIKHFVHESPGMINASVLFDPETLSPAYSLVLGRPGSSYALTIAERLGLPTSLLRAARDFMGADRMRLDAILADMDEKHQDLAAQLEEAGLARDRAVSERDAVTAELEELRAQRRQLLRQAQQEAAALVDRTRRQMHEVLARAERCAVDKAERKELARRVEDKADKLKKGLEHTRERPPANPLTETDVALGLRVHVAKLQADGEIMELSADHKRAMVEVAGMRVQVKVGELTPALGKKAEKALSADLQVRVSRPIGGAPVRMELDLRGKRVDEAVRLLEDYLDAAALAGMREARVIHGFGTGAVRQAVHDRLRDLGHLGYRVGRPGVDPGGEGVTWISFE